MRKFNLSTVLVVVFLGGTIASAAVLGTCSIAAQVLAADPTPATATAGSARVFVDGRLPVRLQAVVEGKLVPAQSGTVTFAQNGQIVLQTGIVAGGAVQVDGLTAGAYSVFVHGEDGFAAFATSVDPASTDGETGDILTVGLVPPTDMPTVERLIRQRSGGSQQLVSSDSTAVAAHAVRNPRSLVHGNALKLSPDGLLRGRVVWNPREDEAADGLDGAAVYFVRNNTIVGTGVTDAEGYFQLAGLSPGAYSLVATGHGTYLALSAFVEPSANSFAQWPVINEISLAAFDDDAESEVSPVYEEDADLMDDVLSNDEEQSDGEFGAFGGGGATGAGGGGGGTGGSDGFAELLGAAAIVVAAFALADDDNRSNVISPATP